MAVLNDNHALSPCFPANFPCYTFVTLTGISVNRKCPIKRWQKDLYESSLMWQWAGLDTLVQKEDECGGQVAIWCKVTCVSANG